MSETGVRPNRLTIGTQQSEFRTTTGPTNGLLNPTVIFFLVLFLSATGLVSGPVALVAGIAFGFTMQHPLRREAILVSKQLLQLSVILLGFGMNLHQVVLVGRSGFLYTAISIGSAAALGLLLGKTLHIGNKASFLITMGTAICGGSAIAALAPVTQAEEEDISISMGTVFVLNSLALLIFPAVGWALHLDQNQFGLWAALAIHDTSSVVGAAAKYGTTALAIGTPVKLARALWIIPVSLLTALFVSRTFGNADSPKAIKVQIPWFILFFVVASTASTFITCLTPFYTQLNHLGKIGLTVTLFLIGTSLSKRTLRQVGVRPLLQGLLLWILVGCASLAAIYFHAISI